MAPNGGGSAGLWWLLLTLQQQTGPADSLEAVGAPLALTAGAQFPIRATQLENFNTPEKKQREAEPRSTDQARTDGLWF